MSRQLEVTDHLNTIPNPPITTKPEDKEVQPAGNKAKEKPKTEEPAPKEKFTPTEKAADHGKMRELE